MSSRSQRVRSASLGLVCGAVLLASACGESATNGQPDTNDGGAGTAATGGGSAGKNDPSVGGSAAGKSGSGGASAGHTNGGSAGTLAGSGGGLTDPGGGGPGQAGAGGAAPGGAPGSGFAGDDGSGGDPTPGSAGSPPVAHGSVTLGGKCDSAADCKSGLDCLTATSQALSPGSPPHGLCTRACELDDDCSATNAGALCVPFGDASYCIEGCAFGTPDIGETKCHGRDDFGCMPALLGDTQEDCNSTDDCFDGELCTGGTCQAVFAGCLPACRGDLDCPSGNYCDQSFLGGACLTEKPTGKRLGETCTMPGGNQPNPCLGFCQEDAPGSGQGHCSTSCGLARGCAWDAASERFDGICFYTSTLTANNGDVGDLGFCTPACNCSDECNDVTLECQQLAQGALSTDFKGPGLCFAIDPQSTKVDACN